MDIVARRITAICAVVAGGIAVLALISWAFGQWQVGTFGKDYVPMAPSTAWLFVLLSGAVFLRSRWPARRDTLVFAAFAVFVVAAFSLLVWSKLPVPIARPLEHWLSGSPMMRSGINAGRMSVITAMTFLAAALAVLLQLPAFSRRRWLRYLASLLASGVVLCGLVMVAGYAMGQPILYGTGFIPMALVTAVAFLFLGTGILCATGMDIWPLRMFGGDVSPESPPLSSMFGWVLGVVLLSTATVIGYLGFLYLNQLDAAARKRAEQEMVAIADLKISQIVEWRKERLSDGDSLFNRRFIASRVREYLANPSRDDVRLEISDWLTQATYRDHYDRIVLLDPQLNVRFSVPPFREEIGPASRQLAQETMRFKQVMLSDLYRHSDSGDIYMDLAIPILARDLSANGADQKQRFPPLSGQPLLGVLTLRINPNRFFFPLIQSWPTPSQTAETLLVRREGDEVVYLNELRHQKGTALNLRIPASARQLPAAMAVRGEVGAVEGVDYRFVPVLAVLRPVPDTPWFMVAKADRQEAYAPLRQQAWTVAVNMGLLALASYLGVALLWRRRELALERERKSVAERLAHLMRHANDMILLADAAGRIVEANDRALESHGYSPTELKQMTLEILRSPASRAAYGQDCKRLTTHGGTLFEAEHQRKDGTCFPVEVSARLVQIAGVSYQLNIIRDITKRRRSEKALRLAEEKYRRIFENAAEGIYQSTPDGRFLSVNPAMAAIHGYASPEEFIAGIWNTADELYVDPGRRVEFKRLIEEQGQVRGFEAQVRRKDGSPMWISINGRAVRDASGRILYYEGTVEDITERKRAEEGLRESEERFRSLSASSPLGIFLADTNGHCDYANPRFRDLFNLSLRETIGRGWLRLVLPEDRASLEEAWSAAVRQSREFSREFRLRTRQNEVRWVHLRTSPMFSGEDKLLGHVGTVEDITESKQAEKELRELSGHLLRAQEEERRRIGEELHDSTAQELAAVVMNLNALQHRLSGKDKEAQTLVADSLAILEHSARDVRTLSHLLHPPFLEEVGLIGALRQYIIGFAQRSGIRVDTEMPESWARLPGDAEIALFRVVQEALGNVHRHSGSPTAIVRLRREDKAITLEVQDRGRGLTRAKDAAEEAVVGVGIAGMRERMRQIGGILEIKSSAQGTTVRAVLPAKMGDG